MDQGLEQVKICAYSACNDGYAGMSIVSLLSLKKWNPDIDLYLITKKLSNANKLYASRLGINVVEHSSQTFHSNPGPYPVDCFFVFYGPEIFADKGYTHCIYIDGDIYCNKFITMDWSLIKTYAGVSHGSIQCILKNDTSKVLFRWGLKQCPSYRIQTGVLFFNNSYAKRVGLASRIEKIYSECISINARRKGDDSLFSAYQCIYQDEQPLLLGNEYNLIIKNRFYPFKKWRIGLESYINSAIFVHFTNASPKPWKLNQQHPCYTSLYFSIKWNQCMIDGLDEELLRHFFHDHYNLLKKSRTRFYWWGNSNVGDLITPYILAKLARVDKLYPLRMHKKDITYCLWLNKLKSQAFWFRGCLINFDKITRLALGVNQYIISAGSVMGLSSCFATIYGSGIRDANQEFCLGLNLVVRGPLTRQRILDQGGCCPPIYGDPGILISLFYKPRVMPLMYKLGICPHFTEYETVQAQYKDKSDVLVINMGCGDIERVLDQISSCEKVLSSSLHGIIFCHSYNIPVKWIKFSDNIKGDDTKFYDYFQGIGLASEPPIDARYYEPIDIDSFYNSISLVSVSVDKHRLLDQMFFDAKSVRTSALFPFAKVYEENLLKAERLIRK
jgi:hypothetical protein